MPINFGLLAPMQQPKTGVIAQAPSSGGGGGNDLGSILSGLGGIVKDFKSPEVPDTSNGAGGVNTSPTGTLNQGIGAALGMNPKDQQSFGNNLSGANQPQDLQSLYQTPAFKDALLAQQTAVKNGVTSSPIMTVVDFSRPANEPRLWTVDTKENKVLMNTYVAQGAGGFNYAPGSHGSETGTFVTGDTYHSASMGKEALRINGLDKGVNDNAFSRGIVVHGGNYVGKDKQGTSWGCFAVPNSEAPNLIGLTKGGTIIHAYAPKGEALDNFSNGLASPDGKKSVTASLVAANPQSIIKNANPELASVMAGISHVESSGEARPYQAMSKPTGSDRAYGKYQIMGKNIPSWTKAALGHPMTPQQFLADPAAQEKTAAYQLNQSLAQGYSPQDVASIWFSGRPVNKAGDSKDVYGTTVPEYVNKFNVAYLRSKGGDAINGNVARQLMEQTQKDSGKHYTPYVQPQSLSPNAQPQQGSPGLVSPSPIASPMAQAGPQPVPMHPEPFVPSGAGHPYDGDSLGLAAAQAPVQPLNQDSPMRGYDPVHSPNNGPYGGDQIGLAQNGRQQRPRAKLPNGGIEWDRLLQNLANLKIG